MVNIGWDIDALCDAAHSIVIIPDPTPWSCAAPIHEGLYVSPTTTKKSVNKFYVLFELGIPGIYHDYGDISRQLPGGELERSGALVRGFVTLNEAKLFWGSCCARFHTDETHKRRRAAKAKQAEVAAQRAKAALVHANLVRLHPELVEGRVSAHSQASSGHTSSSSRLLRPTPSAPVAPLRRPTPVAPSRSENSLSEDSLEWRLFVATKDSTEDFGDDLRQAHETLRSVLDDDEASLMLALKAKHATKVFMQMLEDLEVRMDSLDLDE